MMMEGDCRGSEEGSREACVLPRVADWKLCQRAALLLWCGVVCVRGGLVCQGFGKEGRSEREMVNLVPNISKRLLPILVVFACPPSPSTKPRTNEHTHTGHTQRQKDIHCCLSFPPVPVSWSRPQASVSSSSSFPLLPKHSTHTHAGLVKKRPAPPCHRHAPPPRRPPPLTDPCPSLPAAGRCERGRDVQQGHLCLRRPLHAWVGRRHEQLLPRGLYAQGGQVCAAAVL